MSLCAAVVDVGQGYVRSTSAYLQSARQLEALFAGPLPQSGLGTFEEAQGVAQHHDAVSGTSKQVCSCNGCLLADTWTKA